MQSMPRLSVCLRGFGTQGGFCQNGCFGKNSKTLIVFDDSDKEEIFGAHNCFGHLGDFWSFKKPKDTTRTGKLVLLVSSKNCTPFQKLVC